MSDVRNVFEILLMATVCIVAFNLVGMVGAMVRFAVAVLDRWMKQLDGPDDDDNGPSGFAAA